MRKTYRPSHADYTTDAKYGTRNWQGGGRASARETIGRVSVEAAGQGHWEAVRRDDDRLAHAGHPLDEARDEEHDHVTDVGRDAGGPRVPVAGPRGELVRGDAALPVRRQHLLRFLFVWNLGAVSVVAAFVCLLLGCPGCFSFPSRWRSIDFLPFYNVWRQHLCFCVAFVRPVWSSLNEVYSTA